MNGLAQSTVARTGCCYRLSIARWCSSTLEQGHRKAVVVYWVGREAAKNAKSTQQDNILPYRIRAPGGGVCMVCRFGDQCSEILPSEWFLAQKYFYEARRFGHWLVHRTNFRSPQTPPTNHTGTITSHPGQSQSSPGGQVRWVHKRIGDSKSGHMSDPMSCSY